MGQASRNTPRIHPVILSGGSGTRLWPMSRAHHPKQFIPLTSALSLLQEAAKRVADATRFAPPLFVANDENRFILAEQVRALDVTPLAIVLEPMGRNTAPAACVAALALAASEPDALMLVMPSDHVITDIAAFYAAIDRAAAAAQAGRLVTFGIEADRPETGYGYLKRGAPLDGVAGAYELGAFVEKPDRAHAETYLAAGDYSWNSGIFLFPASLYLSELQRLQPETVTACRRAYHLAKRDIDFLRLDKDAFAKAESKSIDYAVMEHTDHAAVVPVAMGWSDAGTWDALWRLGLQDEHQDVRIGDVVTQDTKRSYLRAEHGLLVTLGVEDLIVVATEDAVLVANRDRAEEVSAMVKRLQRDGRAEASANPIVHRPWGSFRSIHNGERVQVKHITVKPGAKLSLQMHHHRAEHWVVVSGTAKVVRGNEEIILHEDQSTYIPIGTAHRLENPGKIMLHVIEVQSGSYLGEDDIVRFEDSYGRS
ncbi:MAG TPA: mannose-1-phosphate guanylyltransferase/mannose-6-phosphate isomerase [Stellaceae bacterium]|nr:mannose-1-phosphate guanylyltransferase/mannose-6-phosphate isomerase [Stellaceae bacterium]